MDRYVRVEQRKTEQPTIQENEVRIMAAGKMRNYISYATTLLTVQPLYYSVTLSGPSSSLYHSGLTLLHDNLQDKGHDAVVLKAMGRAINKTVTIGMTFPRSLNSTLQTHATFAKFLTP